MSLFKNKEEYFLGIDFGTSALKLVELSYRDEKPYLNNYGQVDIATFKSENSGRLRADVLKKHLNQLVERLSLNAERGSLALPGYDGLAVIVDMPEMSREELDQAMKFEAHKYIPIPLEEVSLSWDIVKKSNEDFFGGQEKEGGKTDEEKGGKKEEEEDGQEVRRNMKVLLVAAPKKHVEYYENIVKGSRLGIGSIELEIFSIVRSLIGDDPENYLIVDIGAQSTNLIMVEKGLIQLNQNIAVGGNELTKLISQNRKVSMEEAEKIKIGEQEWLVTGGEALIGYALEPVINETMHMIDYYKGKNPESSLNGIVLSGGMTNLRGIESYFKQALGAPVMIGDPWKRIFFEDKLQPLVDGLGNSFSVALGLALQGIEGIRTKKNESMTAKSKWSGFLNKPLNIGKK